MKLSLKLNGSEVVCTMDNFEKKFVMEMFLDSDSISTVNRLIVATTDVIVENIESISIFTELLNKEHFQTVRDIENCGASPSPPIQKKRQKVNIEHTVLNYSDSEYFDIFKMRRGTVQALINYLREFDKTAGTTVTLDKKVHVFLWLLTSDSSFSEIAILFGLHKSTVAYIFHEIASLLAEQRHNFISWPSVEEQHITRIKVNSRYKFPNCVGFIDACRFKVGSKRNKKDEPEVIMLQAVCDESLAFIDVHVSDIGVTKKSKVFRESWLCQELKNLIDFDNHLLGDSEYKLKKNLITPFNSEEVLTPEEMKFNDRHWKARSYIGLAFELLKDKFRKLSHIDVNKPDAVQTLLYAACVLHNFIILQEGCPNLKEEPITCDDGVTIDLDIVKTADEKRQFLCNYVNYIDSA